MPAEVFYPSFESSATDPQSSRNTYGWHPFTALARGGNHGEFLPPWLGPSFVLGHFFAHLNGK